MVTIVQLKGGRELVNESKAEELIAAISVENPTHICLSNKSFDNGAAQKISEYINSLNGITIADISDIIAGRPEEEALRTLNIICSSLKKFELMEVNLSDNALGAKGVEACKDILLGDKIEKLYVCNNGLSAEATELLAAMLLRKTGNSSTSTCAPLKLLHFYNNMSGDGGAKAVADIVLATVSTLEDFRFSATRSTPVGCESIAKALLSVPNLRRLDLSDNNFSGKTGELLMEGLRNKTSLEYLNLRDDAIDCDYRSSGTNSNDTDNNTAAAPSLFNALVQAQAAGSALTHLDLSGNNIDSTSAEQLARALDHLPTLTALYLDDCELGSEGAKHIASAVKKLPCLQTLSLCSCEITSCGAYFLARAVAELPLFVNLELNGNQFTENAIEAIQSVLIGANKILGELDDNDEEGDDDLEEALTQFEEAAEEEAADQELIAALQSASI